MEFYVSAGPGTESVLRDELVELGFKSARLVVAESRLLVIGKMVGGSSGAVGQRVMAVLGRFAPDRRLQKSSPKSMEQFLLRQTFAVGICA